MICNEHYSIVAIVDKVGIVCYKLYTQPLVGACVGNVELGAYRLRGYSTGQYRTVLEKCKKYLFKFSV